MKRRAMTTEKARIVRQQGHNDALEFALAVGLSSDYKNNPQAKKDVIDPSGDAHSVKSGKLKWQIFLYSTKRLNSDTAFTLMNGMGQLLLECINAFPQDYGEYQKNKTKSKELLRKPMTMLAEKLQV